MSDSEPDFDDPRWLVDIETPQQELTYQQRRLKNIGRGREKAAASQKRSRKQMEEETREEGLRTNLIAKDTLEGGTLGESKALKMMKGMGFKPGEGLGRKKSPPPEADESKSAPLGTGLGFASSRTTSGSSTPRVDQPRTEPIRFELRERRTGLGVPQAKRAQPFPSHLLPGQSSSEPIDPEAMAKYLSSVKSTMDDRKAHGFLRSIRRTCEELDRRNGIESSVMWRDPDEEEREKTKAFRRRAFLRGDTDYDAELEIDIEAERKYEDSKKGGSLSYDQGTSDTVVDDPEKDETAQQKEDEESQWLALDVGTRLGLTMDYLRREYHYCLFCGCQFDDEKDMEQNCPGPAEEDH